MDESCTSLNDNMELISNDLWEQNCDKNHDIFTIAPEIL